MLDKLQFTIKSIVISILLIATLLLAWSKVLDKKAYTSNLETTKEVAVYLATTRSINAILSVFENTTVELGVGATIQLSVGKIVNPINDFLDRFSWILLISLISLGIQKLILTLGEVNVINILLTFSIFTVIFSQLYSKTDEFISSNAYKLMLVLLFIRFAIPVAEFANSYIYEKVMQNQVRIAQTKMQDMEKSLNEIAKTIKENPVDEKMELLKQEIQKLKDEKKRYILSLSTSKQNYLDSLIPTSVQNMAKSTIYTLNGASSKDYSHYTPEVQKKLIAFDTAIQSKTEQLQKLDVGFIESFQASIKMKLEKINTITDIYFEQTYNVIVLFISRAILFPILFLWLLLGIFKNLFKDDNFAKLENLYREKIQK